MYQKLLISAGGGIISVSQQAEQDECATIAIGLGGTGISCLRTLKKEIFTRVQPDKDAPGTTAPYYRHIKFLAVDTDISSIGSTSAVDTLDANTEFFNISCADIKGLLKGAHMLRQKPYLQWFKTDSAGGEIEILDARAGAGGIRQIGRLLLLQNCASFVEKLTNIIQEAKTGLMDSSNINIHIFTGMAGGTGAGTFLDVCYLLQHVLERLGWEGIAYTCGYFFLPDVNKANHINKDYISVNGFASMKELDYCMNFANNGGHWEQQYDGFSIRTSSPPVQLAHLVTATDAKDRIRNNGYEYAMHVVADYVLEYIIRPFASEREDGNTEEVFNIKSHLTNVALDISMVRKEHGACYNYCVLGAANAYLPYREITTYLTSKIFEGFRDLSRQIPGKNDVNAFIHENGLDYNTIFRNLTRALPPIPNQEVSVNILYEQAAQIQASDLPTSLRRLQSALAPIGAKLDENKRAILDMHPLRSTGEEGRESSLILRTHNALLELAKQTSRGPYYASNLLSSPTSADLIGKFGEYLQQNASSLRQARLLLEQLEEQRNAALNAFQRSLSWPLSLVLFRRSRRRLAHAYFQAEFKRFQQQSTIRQLEAMNTLLLDFQSQLATLHRTFFGKFEEVMKNLQDTFDANLTALTTPVASDDSYAVRLIRIQDLKPSLDRFVENMKLETQIHNFVDEMLRNPEAWSSSEESKICEAVSRHFLDQLKDFTRKNIVDYLSMKFAVITPDALRDEIYEKILVELNQRANLLFWTESFYDIHRAQPMGYLSIPNISDEIRGAAQRFQSGHREIRIRASYSSDRITLYRFACGVPMFGYKGVSTYKQDYKARPIIGSHLYEGASGDYRDSRKMMDISPVSCLSEREYTEQIRERLRLYDDALEIGLLRRVPIGNTTEYRLNIPNSAVVDDWMNGARQALDEPNEETALSLAETLLDKAKDNNPALFSNFYVVPNNGDRAVEELVIRDHVVGSEFYTGLLRQGLETLKSLRDMREKLRELTRKQEQWRADLTAFSRALLCGALFQGGDAYTYCYLPEPDGDFPETLTDMDREPFGLDLPLYSAFLAFRNLTTAQKEAIANTVKRNLRDFPDIVEQAQARLRDTLRSPRVRTGLKAAAEDHRQEYPRIQAFYKSLRYRLDAEEGDAS